MNKTMIEQMGKVGDRNHLCLKGKINTDINSRLPVKPEPLSNWDKYKLIRAGSATLKKNLTVKTMMHSRYDSGPLLVDSFSYPETPEENEYQKAKKAIQGELDTREIALDNAINRLVDEVCAEVIDTKVFLDSMEKLASEKW